MFFLFYTLFSNSQVILNADGPGNTYELINNVYAPSGNVVESPDLLNGDFPGTHEAFGRHITEVWDTDLNKFVFQFYSHISYGTTGITDNDVSTNKTDRQRVEIKTYGSSPSNLKGTIGETVTYKWRFKVPVGFMPTSTFTHIHQVKPVDGDDSTPIFSITLRKGTPNKLEYNYVQSATSGTVKIGNLDLSLFENKWVEVTETIKIGAIGSYNTIIKRVDNNEVLFSSMNNNILTIRPDNTYIRPKWGIYRSIVDIANMRDESILFSDFSIQEGVLPNEHFELKLDESIFPNPISNSLYLISSILDNYDKIKINDVNGKVVYVSKFFSQIIDLSSLSSGIYFVEFLNKGKASKSIKLIKN